MTGQTNADQNQRLVLAGSNMEKPDANKSILINYNMRCVWFFWDVQEQQPNKC